MVGKDSQPKTAAPPVLVLASHLESEPVCIVPPPHAIERSQHVLAPL
jgi:hypothetical protein